MTNELTKNENTSLEAEAPEGAWGSEGVAASDILISKVLLQQPLSTFSLEGKAKPGDMVDSVSAEVLGDTKNPLFVIPISHFKTIVIEGQHKGKWKYVREDHVADFPADIREEYTAKNKDGVDTVHRQNATLNFHVLISNKDPAKSMAALASSFPVVISFRRTSLYAGKALATHLAKSARDGKAPAASVMAIESIGTENDQGSFFVFGNVKFIRLSTKEEIKNAYSWYQLIRSGKAKIDDAEAKETETPIPQEEKGARKF